MPSRKKTQPLGLPEAHENGKIEPVQAKADLPAPSLWALQLVMKDQTMPIQLNVQNKAVIGRSDVDIGFEPDIDLNLFGGLAKGVSRRHAEITATEDSLLIVDLASTNGTRLNGNLLRPHEPYRLSHGDKLQIGTLELQINFAMMPFHKGKIILPKRPTGSLHGINEEDQSHRRILVVENNEDVAEMFAALLRMLEYHVQIVHRTGDAMRYISGRLPHAIFLDLNMPDLPAVDICRMLRHDLSTRHLPVFVLSENSEDERIQEALDVGADMFLSKPVGMDELVRALRHFVGKAKPDQDAGATSD